MTTTTPTCAWPRTDDFDPPNSNDYSPDDACGTTVPGYKAYTALPNGGYTSAHVCEKHIRDAIAAGWFVGADCYDLPTPKSDLPRYHAPDGSRLHGADDPEVAALAGCVAILGPLAELGNSAAGDVATYLVARYAGTRPGIY
jgi:hypothetical protein